MHVSRSPQYLLSFLFLITVYIYIYIYIYLISKRELVPKVEVLLQHHKKKYFERATLHTLVVIKQKVVQYKKATATHHVFD
jgi:hypothetical protein